MIDNLDEKEKNVIAKYAIYGLAEKGQRRLESASVGEGDHRVNLEFGRKKSKRRQEVVFCD